MIPPDNTPVPPVPVVPAPALTPKSPGRLMPRLDLQEKLYRLGIYVLSGCGVYFIFTAETADAIHLYLGLLIFVLAAVPGLVWARRSESSFPIFEVFMLTFVNTYALPLLTGHQQLALYDPDVITKAAVAVLLFQIVAVVTYRGMECRPKQTPFWTEEVISEEYSRFLSYGMTLTTIYTIISTFFDVIPYEALAVLRAVFYGIGIISTFVTCRRWGAGTLPLHDQYYFVFNLGVQFLFLISSLFLIAGISLLVLAMLGYISGSKRLPYVPLLLLLPVLALLHNGKGAMRAKYWDNSIRPTMSELPAFFSEWLSQGLPSTEKKDARVTAKLLERTSLFHIICLVVARTPAHEDYLYGETYQDIPGQFVPRYFWPDKPVAHVSTNTLARYYGLQSEEGSKKTTIAFGMLAEAYANFGFFGVGCLAFVFSGALRLVTGWGANSPTLSYGGLLLVMLMAWSFQVELTLSIWLTSLFQGCVAILGMPLLVRAFGI